MANIDSQVTRIIRQQYGSVDKARRATGIRSISQLRAYIAQEYLRQKQNSAYVKSKQGEARAAVAESKATVLNAPPPVTKQTITVNQAPTPKQTTVKEVKALEPTITREQSVSQYIPIEQTSPQLSATLQRIEYEQLPTSEKLESQARSAEIRSQKTDTTPSGQLNKAYYIAASIGGGFVSRLAEVGTYIVSRVKEPTKIPGDVAELGKNVYTAITNPKETATAFATQVKENPFTTAGSIAFDVVATKGAVKVLSTARTFGVAQVTKLSPRYTPTTKGGGRFGTFASMGEEIKVVGGVSDTATSLRNQAKIAGTTPKVLTSGQEGFFKFPGRELVKLKPRPGDPIGQGFFVTPTNQLRTSRMGLQVSEAVEEASLSLRNIKFGVTKPQAVIFRNTPVESLPKDIFNNLARGKGLTGSQKSSLLKQQITPSGQFKPIGYLSRELEATVPPGQSILKTGKSGVTVINTGKTIFSERRVPIIEAELLPSKGSTNVKGLVPTTTFSSASRSYFIGGDLFRAGTLTSRFSTSSSSGAYNFSPPIIINNKNVSTNSNINQSVKMLPFTSTPTSTSTSFTSSIPSFSGSTVTSSASGFSGASSFFSGSTGGGSGGSGGGSSGGGDSIIIGGSSGGGSSTNTPTYGMSFGGASYTPRYKIPSFSYRSPTYDEKEEKKKKKFDIFIRRKGKDYLLTSKSSLAAAKFSLTSALSTSAAASGYIKKGKQKIKTKLGMGFRQGKSDPFRIVQKRSYRIGSIGEKREITFKGININKARGLI